MQCNRASTCKFYGMTTVTYNKLEHAQLKRMEAEKGNFYGFRSVLLRRNEDPQLLGLAVEL